MGGAQGWVGFGRVPLVQLCMISDKWLHRYRLLENSNTDIPLLQDVLDFDLYPPPPGMDPTGYLWFQYELFLISGCKDIDF